MINESERRRLTFRDGPKVKLADGQGWTFPPPVTTVVFPVRDENGSFAAGGRGCYGPAHEDRLDEMYSLGNDQESNYKRMSIRLDLAARLLLENYDLTDREVGRLLRFDFADEDSRASWDEVLDVINGSYAPKVSAGGSAAPSSSTASPAPSTSPTPSTAPACS